MQSNNLKNRIVISMKKKGSSMYASAAKVDFSKSVMRSMRLGIDLGNLPVVSASAAFGQGASSTEDPALQIDIPTMLERGSVVIDFVTQFTGDMPFALGDIGLLAADFRDWNTKGQVVVFQGDAAYFVLNDESYNMNRHVATGNPNKNLLNGLMGLGVQLELCGATAKGNHWAMRTSFPGSRSTSTRWSGSLN